MAVPMTAPPENGSPAGAGIDRVGVAYKSIGPRFPRRRGDRPNNYFLTPDEFKVPPQARAKAV